MDGTAPHIPRACSDPGPCSDKGRVTCVTTVSQCGGYKTDGAGHRHPLLAFGPAAAILAGASAGWGLAGPFGPATAQAAPQVYEYRVEHPLYGDIGTYTNIVDQSGDSAEVETKLNIVVKLLGVVVHRQAAERREDWEHGRLTLFRVVTH